MHNSLHTILFGQTGSGKSSVINLIAGKEIAPVSNGAAGCTLSFTPYTCPAVSGRNYHIWDTVGLDEADMERVSIDMAMKLIHNLRDQGGVDLLLFCIRAPRITATSQMNYRLFYEVLCGSRVPIAFVITHLEQEADMEKWWERNIEAFETYGLKSAGHACVTALPTDSKYRESRRNITKLLAGYNSNGRLLMPADGWFIQFLRLFGLFSTLKKGSKKKDIIRVLVERCGMEAREAENLAVKLEGGA